MLTSIMLFIFIAAAIAVGLIIVTVLLVKSFYVKVPQGTALIVNNLSSVPKVTFTGSLVWPVIYKKEFMRISLITLEIDRRGSDGLICRDNIRADITVAFYLKVNATQEDVLKVAKSIGADRASDHTAVGALFNAKFSEALKTVGKQFDFEHLFAERQRFRDEIVKVIGNDLNGYALEDVAIDYLDQTPIEHLKKENIMDAEGIRKIVEKTATEIVRTNEIDRDKDLAITKKNVETREATLALERQQKDAELRQEREIKSIAAREKSESDRVEAEEEAKAEIARQRADEEKGRATIQTQRELEMANKDKQRTLEVEDVNVQKAVALKEVEKQRELELTRKGVEIEIEEKNKEKADYIRARVAVEKTVAQEEERIKDVREVSEAERNKQVNILEAQAEAERDLVRQVKQAEADAETSKFKTVEIANMAQAELDAAAKQAEAKKRLAEGLQAEQAAPGLADAKVREVQASVREKEGLVEAKVKAEQMIAEARGLEEQGLAEARVTENKASAKEKDGLADAKVAEEKGFAEARVISSKAEAKEKDGLVDARLLEERLGAQARGEEQVGLVKAKVNRELGEVDAAVLLKRLVAEAEGLSQKFASINMLSDTGRAHEEFRIQLERSLEQSLAAIAANKEIAKEQAEVLAAGLAKTKIDVVGGEGEFFEKFSKALAVGKSIDGLVNNSTVVQGAMQQLLSATADKLSGANKNTPKNNE